MTSTATPRQARPADARWADLAGTGLHPNATIERDGRERPLYWSDTAALAAELVEMTGGRMDVQSARVLADFCHSGLPVQLTFQRKVGDWIETMKVAAIVQYAFVTGHPSSDRIQVRYSGFGHSVHLTDIVQARSFENELTFTPVDR